MNYALIVYRSGDYCGECEAVFKYQTDAERLAECVHNTENAHTAVIKLGTGVVICEFET